MRRDEPQPDARRTEVGHNSTAPVGETQGERIAELYRQHGKELLRRLEARVGSPHEARDIAQEACVRLLALERPSAVRSLRGYLWKIATNIATDRGRAKKYRDTLNASLVSGPELSSPSPELVCVAHERLAICEKAIAQLPPKCRTAFILRVIDGLPFEEIAQRMRIDVSGVKRYVARAAVHCQEAVDSAEQI